MQNFILHFFHTLKMTGVCRHEHALLNSEEGYCPDCGQYLKKYYYVLRCKCCDVKRDATRAYFSSSYKIMPTGKFCTNCGSEDFYIEKLEKLNLTDIYHAIEVKECMPESEIRLSMTQVWVEEPHKHRENDPLRFLPNRARG